MKRFLHAALAATLFFAACGAAPATGGSAAKAPAANTPASPSTASARRIC